LSSSKRFSEGTVVFKAGKCSVEGSYALGLRSWLDFCIVVVPTTTVNNETISMEFCEFGQPKDIFTFRENLWPGGNKEASVRVGEFVFQLCSF
jgi:hypothetical protein